MAHRTTRKFLDSTSYEIVYENVTGGAVKASVFIEDARGKVTIKVKNDSTELTNLTKGQGTVFVLADTKKITMTADKSIDITFSIRCH